MKAGGTSRPCFRSFYPEDGMDVSETSVEFRRTTGRYIPEDSALRSWIWPHFHPLSSGGLIVGGTLRYAWAGSHWDAVVSCVTDRVEVGRCPSCMHVRLLLLRTYGFERGPPWLAYYKWESSSCIRKYVHVLRTCNKILDEICFHIVIAKWITCDGQTTIGSFSRHYNARALRNMLVRWGRTAHTQKSIDVLKTGCQRTNMSPERGAGWCCALR